MNNKKNEYEDNKVLVDRILDRLDVVGVLANPKIGLEYIKERDKDKETEVDKEIEDFIEEIKATTPDTITLDLSDHYKTKFFLPKYKRDNIKRNLGISELKDDEKAGD